MFVDYYIQQEIESRIVSDPVGEYLLTLTNFDQPQHSGWNPPVGGFTRNPACWASDLDFSGVGSWKRIADGRWYFATLISPRHVITAHHIAIPIGTTIYFIREDGTVYEAEVESFQRTVGYIFGPDHVAYTDIRIAYLTEDVPPDLKHYMVPPPDYFDYLAQEAEDLRDVTHKLFWGWLGDGMFGKPIVFLDKFRKALIGRCHGHGITGWAPIMWVITGGKAPCGGSLPETRYPDRTDYFELLETGDSGSPYFLLVDGELVLLGFVSLSDRHYCEGVRTPMAEGLISTTFNLSAEINPAMYALGGINDAMADLNTGDVDYQPTLYSFPEYPPGPQQIVPEDRRSPPGIQPYRARGPWRDGGGVTDYVGRTTDVLAYDGAVIRGEVLLDQTLAQPNEGGKICAGIQKLAQRFLLELLTEKGTMTYLPTRGTDFMYEARIGRFRTQLDVCGALSRALVDVKRNLRIEESNADPADERYKSAEIFQVVYAPGEAKIWIRIFSQDDNAIGILPISVAL